MVVSHQETQDIMTKNGPMKLKKLNVTDSSKKVVELTVWGELTGYFDNIRQEMDNNCILAIANGTYKNHEQYGRQLSTGSGSKIYVNPVDFKSLRDK